MRLLPPRPWSPRRLAGLLAVLLALASHVAAGSLVGPDRADQRAAAAIAAVDVICHGGHPAQAPRRPSHQVTDPALCPSWVAGAASALPVSGPWLTAPPTLLELRGTAPPPVRAPPAAAPRTILPRGPPILV